MPARVKVSTEMLGRVLFGHDEVNILNVNDATDLGYIELIVAANPDLGFMDGEEINIQFRTEVRIIERRYRRVHD